MVIRTSFSTEYFFTSSKALRVLSTVTVVSATAFSSSPHSSYKEKQRCVDLCFSVKEDLFVYFITNVKSYAC